MQGPVRVIPREFAGIRCKLVDVASPLAAKGQQLAHLRDLMLEELMAEPSDCIAAWRGERRYEEVYRPAALPAVDEGALPLRNDGTYMITGGFGGIGLTLAEDLVRRHGARIVLVARTPLPPRSDWEAYKFRHGSHAPVSRRIAAVEKLENLGGQVMVVVADVSNVEEMRGALEQVQLRFGEVNGLIHAAGMIADAPIAGKTPDQIEDVFTPKIHGTEVLSRLFPDGALD